jgi:hypothetical protein
VLLKYVIVRKNVRLIYPDFKLEPKALYICYIICIPLIQRSSFMYLNIVPCYKQVILTVIVSFEIFCSKLVALLKCSRQVVQAVVNIQKILSSTNNVSKRYTIYMYYLQYLHYMGFFLCLHTCIICLHIILSIDTCITCNIEYYYTSLTSHWLKLNHMT